MLQSNEKKSIVGFKPISELVIIGRIITFDRKKMLEVVIKPDVPAFKHEQCCDTQQNDHGDIEETFEHQPNYLRNAISNMPKQRIILMSILKIAQLI
jgi:hypothetical protein